MSTIDQYLEVINERLQEENKQGINRADTGQYLQEMSLKYFREYEVEFEKVKEEDKKNLALERVKGFYECLIQIASDDKFDSQFEKTCWSSFIAAHRFGLKKSYNKRKPLGYGLFAVLGIEASDDIPEKTQFKEYKISATDLFNMELKNYALAGVEQIQKLAKCFSPLLRYYAPVLDFIPELRNQISSSDFLKFFESLGALPMEFLPKYLLFLKADIHSEKGEYTESLEILKICASLPKNSEDKFENLDELIHSLRIDLLEKSNRYDEAQELQESKEKSWFRIQIITNWYTGVTEKKENFDYSFKSYHLFECVEYYNPRNGYWDYNAYDRREIDDFCVDQKSATRFSLEKLQLMFQFENFNCLHTDEDDERNLDEDDPRNLTDKYSEEQSLQDWKKLKDSFTELSSKDQVDIIVE